MTAQFPSSPALKLRIRPALASTAVVGGVEAPLHHPPAFVELNRYLVAELVRDEPTEIVTANVQKDELARLFPTALAATLTNHPVRQEWAVPRPERPDLVPICVLSGEEPWATAAAVSLASGWWPDADIPRRGHVLVAVPTRSVVLCASVDDARIESPAVRQFEEMVERVYDDAAPDRRIFRGVFWGRDAVLSPLRNYDGPRPLHLDGEPRVPANPGTVFAESLKRQVRAAVANFLVCEMAQASSNESTEQFAAGWCTSSWTLTPHSRADVAARVVHPSSCLMELMTAISLGRPQHLEAAARQLHDYARSIVPDSASQLRGPWFDPFSESTAAPVDEDERPEDPPQLPLSTVGEAAASVISLASCGLDLAYRVIEFDEELAEVPEALIRDYEELQADLLEAGGYAKVAQGMLWWEVLLSELVPESPLIGRFAQLRHLLGPAAAAIPGLEKSGTPTADLSSLVSAAHWALVQFAQDAERTFGTGALQSAESVQKLMQAHADAASFAATDKVPPEMMQAIRAWRLGRALTRAAKSGNEARVLSAAQELGNSLCEPIDAVPPNLVWLRRATNRRSSERMREVCEALALDYDRILADADAGRLTARPPGSIDQGRLRANKSWWRFW